MRRGPGDAAGRDLNGFGLLVAELEEVLVGRLGERRNGLIGVESDHTVQRSVGTAAERLDDGVRAFPAGIGHSGRGGVSTNYKKVRGDVSAGESAAGTTLKRTVVPRRYRHVHPGVR